MRDIEIKLLFLSVKILSIKNQVGLNGDLVVNTVGTMKKQ